MIRSIAVATLLAVSLPFVAAAQPGLCGPQILSHYGKDAGYFTRFPLKRAAGLGLALQSQQGASDVAWPQVISQHMTALELRGLYTTLADLHARTQGCLLPFQSDGEEVWVATEAGPVGEILVSVGLSPEDFGPAFIAQPKSENPGQQADLIVLSAQGVPLYAYRDSSLDKVEQVIKQQKQNLEATGQKLQETTADLEQQAKALADSIASDLQTKTDRLMQEDIQPFLERSLTESQALVRKLCGLSPDVPLDEQAIADGCSAGALMFLQQHLLDSGALDQGLETTEDLGENLQQLAEQAARLALEQLFRPRSPAEGQEGGQ